MIDRDDILRMAKERGVRVKQMIALAPQNDPFFCGAPAQERDARWFADVWAKKNDPRLHLRELHYQISTYWRDWSSEPFVMPNGMRYENTKKCWRWIQDASKYARNLGYIDPEEIGDQYTPQMLMYADTSQPEDPEIDVVSGYGISSLPGLPRLSGIEDVEIADFTTYGYGDVIEGPHVEIWAEKSSVTRYIDSLCQQYRVNLLPAKGYMTQTSIIRFLRRAEQSGRSGRILYISDFDYSGNNMPVQVARYIEFYQQHPGYPEFNDLDIRIHQLAVTPAQVKEYDLPLDSVPLEKMNSRHEEWIDQAAGIVEVEAINPHLAKITEATLKRYRDETVRSRAWKAQNKLMDDLDAIRDRLIGDLGIDEPLADYKQLQKDVRALADEFGEMIGPFQGRIDSFQQRHDELRVRLSGANDLLLSELEAAAADVDLDFYPIPEPELPDEPSALYDSRRDYLGQLQVYQNHRHNRNGA